MAHTVVQTDDLDEFDWDTITTTYREDDVTPERIETTFDNGVYLDERFYADGNIETRFRTDGPDGTDGQHSWSSISAVFNQEGERTGRFTIYDDGRTKSETWLDGLRVESLREDPDNARSWHRIEHLYDANGKLATKITTNDDGVVENLSYWPDGTLASRTLFDELDAYDWADEAWVYDQNGVTTGYAVNYDDGYSSSESYVDGLLSVRLQLDGPEGTDGTRSWSEITTFYGENEEWVARNTIYDNGTYKGEVWQNGLRSIVLWEDHYDAKSWDWIEYHYDGNGVLASKSTTNDDGTTKEEYWQDGVRTETLQQDRDNARSWDVIEFQYDENGVLASKGTTNDDGTTKEEYWQDGVRTETLQQDRDDAKSWDVIEFQYDENGLLASKGTTNDDGTTKVELREDGVRTETVQEDPDNAQSWTNITITYDETGGFASKTINYDNGDIYEKSVAPDIFDIEEMGLEAEYVTFRTNYGPENSWAEHTTIDFNGPYYLRMIELDNGNEKVAAFLPDLEDWGMVKVVGEFDDADLFSWEEKIVVNSLTLDRKDTYYRYDNADEELTFFDTEADELEFYAQRDSSDQEDWQGQQSFYEDGDLSRIVTQSDAGDFEIEYFSAGVSTGTESLSSAEYEDAYGDFNAVWEPYLSAVSEVGV